MFSGNEILLVVIGFVFGFVFAGATFLVSLRIRNANKNEERAKHKLASTQQNIVGQISNALSGGIRSNLQWGHRLLIDTKLETPSSIIIFDQDAGFVPYPIVIEITVGCDFRLSEIRIAVIGTEVLRVKSPNDPQLTLLIGSQLDLVQKWSPKTTS